MNIALVVAGSWIDTSYFYCATVPLSESHSLLYEPHSKRAPRIIDMSALVLAELSRPELLGGRRTHAHVEGVRRLVGVRGARRARREPARASAAARAQRPRAAHAHRAGALIDAHARHSTRDAHLPAAPSFAPSRSPLSKSPLSPLLFPPSRSSSSSSADDE